MKKILAASAAVLLICALFIPLLLRYAGPFSDEIIPLDPTADDMRGWEFYTCENGLRTPLEIQDRSGTLFYYGLEYEGQAFYRSRIMTEQLDSPLLNLGVANVEVAVFLDDELIYTDAYDTGYEIGNVQLTDTEKQRTHGGILISLPLDYAGRTLTVVQASSPGEKPGYTDIYPCPVTLYSTRGYESVLISQSWQDACNAIIPAVLAFLLLIFFVLRAVRGKLDLGLFFLSLFLLLQSAEVVISASYAISYFDGYRLDAVTLCRLCSTMAMALFLCTRMQKFQKTALAVAALQFISIVISALTQLNLLVPYGDTYMMLVYLAGRASLLAMILITVFALLEWRLHNRFFALYARITVGLAAAYLLFLCISPLVFPGYLQNTLQRLSHNGNTVYLLRLFNGLMIIPGIASVSIDLIRQEIARRTDFTMLTMKSQAAYESLKNMQDNISSLREMRHNMLHHLTVMESLGKSGQTDRLQEYISALTQETGSVATPQYTAHPVVNAILSSELARAEKDGVEAETHVSLPEYLDIADNDLCALLMNMINNALEACAGMEEGVKKWICITMHIRGKYCYIGVENSKNGPVYYDRENNICISTKGNRTAHGYGMKTMEQIAKRYDSKLHISFTDSTFHVNTALLLKPASRPDTLRSVR